MNELPTDEAAPGRMLLEFFMDGLILFCPALKSLEHNTECPVGAAGR
jgi:hypothetical protein